MRPLPKTLFRILLIAVVYALLGRVAWGLTIPPGYVAAIWPSAGIALAAMLIWGYRVWPGVALGSLIADTWMALEAGTAGSVSSVVLSAVIAMGAALQCAGGAYLVRRFIGTPCVLAREGDVVRFLLLGGPVSCVVNALLGSAMLLAWGVLQPHAFLANAATWWIGDSIGVVLVTPFALALAGRPREAWRLRGRGVAVPLALSCLIVFVLFTFANRSEQQRMRGQFRDRAEQLADAVQHDTSAYVEILHAIRGLYDSSTHVDRAEFATFVGRFLERYPGVQALEWIPRVRQRQRAAFEGIGRRDLSKPFEIRERGAGSERVRAGRREEYYPVRYVEPERENRAVLGFDLATEPGRAEALRRARDTGQAVATPPMTLLQGSGSKPGIIVYVPIYRGEPRTREERRSRLVGFAGGVFPVGELVQAALRDRPVEGIVVRLIDRGAPRSERVLAVLEEGRLVGKDSGEAVLLEVPFEMGQRHWVLQFAPSAEYRWNDRSFAAWAVLGLGFLLAAAVGAFLLVSTGRTFLVEQVVAERTLDLRASQEQIQKVLDTAQDAFVRTDEQGRILEWNPQAEATFGWTRQEILGRIFADTLIAPADREAHREERRMYLSDGRRAGHKVRRERRAVRRSGEEFLAELTMSPAHVRGRWQFNTFIRDITEERKAEEKLRSSEARLRLLLTQVPCVLWSVDREFRMTLLVGARMESLGRPGATLVGKSLRDVVPMAEAQSVVMDAHRRALRGEAAAYDLPWGATSYQCHVEPLRGTSGEILGAVGVAIDISERKKAEAMKSEFISIVSHELRTPLTAMHGSLAALARGAAGPLPASGQQMAEIAFRSCERLVRLVTDVLDSEKIELGRMALVPRPIEVTALLRQAIEDNQGYARRHGTEFVLGREVPGAMVHGDFDRMLQVLANLLSNAAKFSPRGQPVLVEAERRAERIRVSVIDRGEGVPEGFRSRLFEKFSQASAGRGGTGLGLSIAKAIVERHGGVIGFESEPCVRTTFYFELAEWRAGSGALTGAGLRAG